MVLSGSEPAWIRHEKKAKRQSYQHQKKEQGKPIILARRDHLTLARRTYAYDQSASSLLSSCTLVLGYCPEYRVNTRPMALQ